MVHCAFSGEHFSPRIAVDRPADGMVTRFFWRAISITASAVDAVGKSVIMSTLPWSNHSRARLAATSGLFWWSAATTSTGLPSTLLPISSAAMRAATTEPLPARSE